MPWVVGRGSGPVQCGAPPKEDNDPPWLRRAPEKPPHSDIFLLHCAMHELALKAKGYKLTLTTFG